MVKKNIQTIDAILAYGIYLYIFMMFLAKGEGFRNILIFGSFGLWLLTVRHRKDRYLLKELLPVLWWIFLGTTVIAAIFSIDPYYSLRELKGEPLKSALLFPVIATVCSDEKRLIRVVYTVFFILTVITLFGYYSYLFLDTPVLKPHTALIRAHHNRFAGYLNTLMPLAFILFFTLKHSGARIIVVFSLSLSAIALVLSTSRGGYIAFFFIAAVWSLYLSKTAGYSFKKLMSSLIIFLCVVGAFSFFGLSGVRDRISETSEQISTLSKRTDLWQSAIFAIKKRPVRGWGYGNKIFHEDVAFDGNPYKKDPEKGIHNKFLAILFQQGLMGFIPFVLLMGLAITSFWKAAMGSDGIKGYVLVACAAVFVGNYTVHAMLEGMFKLHHISVILALGVAAGGIQGALREQP